MGNQSSKRESGELRPSLSRTGTDTSLSKRFSRSRKSSDNDDLATPTTPDLARRDPLGSIPFQNGVDPSASSVSPAVGPANLTPPSTRVTAEPAAKPTAGHSHSGKTPASADQILSRKVKSILATTDYETSPSPAAGSAKSAEGDSIDVDDMISRLIDAAAEGKISKSLCLKQSEVISVCNVARNIFLRQPPLLELSAPVKIAGDIHGQYYDLIRLFRESGFPPDSNYLFLGDYVDRGKQSLETILLLFCYKIKFPNNFFLLRGNHECANVTRVYGFYDECKRRAHIKVWKAFIDVFNTLPLAAIVAGKIFCVHGGLSPDLTHMDDIKSIMRPTDVPDRGLLNDLLWSDPSDMDADWANNERGVSYCFGKRIISSFLQKHNFDLVCRAHMVVENGYEFFSDRVLVTIFSAPNYCGEFDNSGAVMSVNEDLLCSFEILPPMEKRIKGSKKRGNMSKSPPANQIPQSV